MNTARDRVDAGTTSVEDRPAEPAGLTFFLSGLSGVKPVSGYIAHGNLRVDQGLLSTTYYHNWHRDFKEAAERSREMIDERIATVGDELAALQKARALL